MWLRAVPRHVDFLVQKEKLEREHQDEELSRAMTRKIKEMTINMTEILTGVGGERSAAKLVDFPHRRVFTSL